MKPPDGERPGTPARQRPRPSWCGGRGARFRDTLLVGAAALALRSVVVAWAWGRVGPVADGTYYHRLAERLSAGQGYTWQWPDGAVTYAAHYPVGYPALMAPLYAWLGPEPGWAMVLNALLGTLGAVAVHRLLLATMRSRVVGAVGGLLVAAHPGLVGYTPALMTEGVTAALLAVALWATAVARSSRRRRAWVAALFWLGATLGVATLVRPQSLLLAPLLGLACVRPRAFAPALGGGRSPWRSSPWLARGAAVTLVLATALGVCAPWTARNCARMGSCALVSVNAGWNLLIGTDAAADGGWAPVKVPGPCREVFDEAAKDECFARAAWENMRTRPAEWLALAPRKLAATFDYCGAPGWYLHEAAPLAFGPAAKERLGVLETVFERLTLVGALAALVRWPRRGHGLTWHGHSARGWLRAVLVAAGVLAALSRPAWLGYLALLGALALRRPWLWRTGALWSGPWAVVLTTVAAHAVFFGGGRYALVVFPALCALAALGIVRWIAAVRRGPFGAKEGTRTPTVLPTSTSS